ncbi:MAG: TonB-dependent receptor, partial [Bryobacteraceae bacterium]
MILKLAALLALATIALSQADTGELRITVRDPSGLPLQARAEVASEANQYTREFDTNAEGQVIAKRLPFGFYTVRATSAGFAPASKLVEVRSAIPLGVTIALGLGPVNTTVNVNSDATLIDPSDVSSANRIGNATLEDRLTAQPGRALGELVNQEPGWLFEANGVLHPRGEEYQTQYVIDGLPLTENRSAAYVSDFSANDVQEMSIYTAGFPAEYGRKMGGVVEVETQRDKRPGFHGNAVLSGGNFDTAGAYLEALYGWGKNTFTLSGSATTTDRYLDPPTLENYSNHGTLIDSMAHYERDLTDKDRIGVILRREQSRFLVPDEIVQEQAGQRQDRDNFESAAQLSYEHIFSPDVLGDFRAMVRDLTAGFWSNDLSTPMIASQDRGYHEEYVKGTVSVHAGHHEFKTGFESDYASLQESLYYLITNPTQFDPGTPLSFNYYGHAPDREQGVFGQDQMHWKNLTLSGGIRFDHYDLLVNQVGWSPRAGIAVYWPRARI